MNTGRLLRWSAVIAGTTLAAGLVVPRLQADRYHGRIQAALESALGRSVTIGQVRFNLLTGPGFTVNDVVVAEDPALGQEPVAYVDRIVATPRLLSLLTGHLAFSSLRLEDAHLNLARTDLPSGQYRWNLEPLLRPALITAFPNLTIHGARINFKAANVKSVVYLLESNLTITPPTQPDYSWQFRFEGKPARADRPARGSGLVRANGSWKPGMLKADLQLKRSELGDLIAVIRGEDAGLHGLISGNARFSGPLDNVAIAGKLRVEEVHGWDQDIPKGEQWPLSLQGRWSASKQQIELNARVTAQGSNLLSVHYLVDQYLTVPRWGASVSFTKFPASPLIPIARHMGVAISDGLELTGELDGVIGFSVADGYGGEARLSQASVRMPGLPQLEFERAQVVIASGVARLEPSRVRNAGQQEAVLEAEYALATGDGRFRITARDMDAGALARQLPPRAVPLLSEATSGKWSGALQWSKTGNTAGWSGDIQLSKLEFRIPALALPLLIDSAECLLQQDRISVQRLRAHAGTVAFSGDYRFEPEAAHPHRLRLLAGVVDAADLEQLFLPTLRRSRELLGVSLPFRKASLPEWLANLHAEGTVQFAALTAGEWRLPNLHTSFQWDAARVVISDVSNAEIAGKANVDLQAEEPLYFVTARVRNQEWKGGHLSIDTAATLHGTGARLLNSVQATGDFTAANADDNLDQLSGRYALTWRESQPRIVITGVRVQSSNEIYTGAGGVQNNGTLQLQLLSQGRQAHVTGTLLADTPLKWTTP